MRLQGISVLLVEDDVDNLELLSIALESEGAVTYSAGSIAGALALVGERPLDVVVSDLELPDGDGCTLLRKLRPQARDTTLPAIAVTGYSEQAWRNQAADCGFVRYAIKPFSMEQLVRWIGELSDPSRASVDS